MNGSSIENYLTQYRNRYPLHVADLLRIWYHYDVDKSGYLEIPKFKIFLEDLITSGGNKTTKKEVDDYARHMKLSLKDFDVIFYHYNRSGTGRLDHFEFLGFIFNLMEKVDAIKDPSIKDIEAYKVAVLRSIGKKGKSLVSKEDLQLFFI